MEGLNLHANQPSSLQALFQPFSDQEFPAHLQPFLKVLHTLEAGKLFAVNKNVHYNYDILILVQGLVTKVEDTTVANLANLASV